MKKVVGTVAVIITLIVVSIGVYYNYATKSPLKGEEVTVVVNEGDSLYNVLDTLDSQGAIKSKTLMKMYIKLNNISVSLVPGTFKVSGDVTVGELLKTLESGISEDSVTVTVPEGYDIEKMALLFEKSGLFTKEEFIKAVNSYPVPDYIPKSEGRRYDLEGFLFPDTYNFTKGVKPEEVIAKMNNTFYDKISSALPTDADIYKMVTIASIIENETKADEERAIVSSVIYNRLEIEKNLEIDATVIYALGHHVDTVSLENLEIDSPYNTYKYTGLPLGPISSPGLASISAAANPGDTNYLFYVLEKDKTHHYFTDNYEDHKNKLKELGY